MTSIDASGAEAMRQLVESLRRQGISMAVARAKSPLMERFDAIGLTTVIGEDHFYPTVRAAVDACRGTPDDHP